MNFYSPGEAAVPDKALIAKEDQMMKLSMEKLSVEDRLLPLRPSYGSKGVRFLLRTNYFHVTLDINKSLLRYDVKVRPDMPKGRKRRQLFNMLFEEFSDFMALGGGKATDYASTLITSRPLFGTSESKVYTVKFHDENDTPRPGETDTKVTITKIGVVNSSELL